MERGTLIAVSIFGVMVVIAIVVVILVSISAGGS